MPGEKDFEERKKQNFVSAATTSITVVRGAVHGRILWQTVSMDVEG